jgi:transposase
MPKRIELRPLTQEEHEQLTKLSRSRTAESRLVERAKMILWTHEGYTREEIAARLGRSYPTILRWIKAFNEKGFAGLDDAPRSGRPLEYSEHERGQMIGAARTHPQKLGRPYGHWTLSRLVEYVNKELRISISRAQLARVLEEEGLRWYQEQTYFTERPDPLFAAKRGR